MPIPPRVAAARAKPGSPDWPGESLTVGMMAPEFSLPSTLGRKVSLSEFRGKRVGPLFLSQGRHARVHHGSMRLPGPPAADHVQGRGRVWGCSLDDELSHQRFAQKYNLPFALLSDVDARGLAAVRHVQGEEPVRPIYWGIERTTFVIDREGARRERLPAVKVEGHAEEVMATLAI